MAGEGELLFDFSALAANQAGISFRCVSASMMPISSLLKMKRCSGRGLLLLMRVFGSRRSSKSAFASKRRWALKWLGMAMNGS